MKLFVSFPRVAFMGAVLLCVGLTRAHAATFTVTNTNDSGTGSLRQAVTEANDAASDDIINFSGSAFADSATITLTSGQLDVTGSGTLTINPPTTGKLLLSGNNTVRIFRLPLNSNANLTLNGITFTAGVGHEEERGGGGAIFSQGTLTVNNCTFAGNGNNNNGGAINNNGGTLIINSSTFVNNKGSVGGAIFTTGKTTLNNCTLVGNSAAGLGGAICSLSTFKATSTIIVGNTAPNGPDIDGPAPLNNHNIIGGTAAEAGLQADPDGTPVLAYNGGPTPTVALVAGSPAIDAGNSTLATDQRGLERRFDFPKVANAQGGNGSDIGAYELK